MRSIIRFIFSTLLPAIFAICMVLLLVLTIVLFIADSNYILNDDNKTATRGNISKINKETIILNNYQYIGNGISNRYGTYVIYSRSDRHEVIYVYNDESDFYKKLQNINDTYFANLR